MTKIVGILNITPDSFSDGGVCSNSINKSIEQMIDDGADVIDIGAESTCPDANPISQEEEWDRLEPVMESLGKYKDKVNFGIDTRNPTTAELACTYGVTWINDVSAFSHPKMCRIAKEYGSTCVFMHSLTVPADSSVTIPENENIIQTIYQWAKDKLVWLRSEGLENLIFDPGIGFGKTAHQSFDIIKNISQFKSLGVPIMVGHSRKSFLKLITNAPPAERDDETANFSGKLAQAGVDYIRVHNVKTNKKAIELIP